MDTSYTKNIKEEANKVIAQIDKSENPNLKILRRSLNNVFFDENKRIIKLGDKQETRSYFNINQAKKFMQTIKILAQINENLQKKTPNISTRQLFYMTRGIIENTDEECFEDQSESDPIIEDVEVILDTLREELGLIATPDGYFVGDIKVKDLVTGDLLDYTKMGSGGGAIPAIVEKDVYEIVECKAKFVVVLEKFAVWNILNQTKFWQKHNCIILTGKGQAGRSARRLLTRLSKEMKLPVYVLTDLDPWGYYIYSVYKQGSISLAYFSEKSSVPTAKYIGMTTRDIIKYKIPKSSWMKLKDIDYKRIKEIKKYDWFQAKEWQEELTLLEEFKYKVESDAFVTKSVDFVVNEYLPDKIKRQDFLP